MIEIGDAPIPLDHVHHWIHPNADYVIIYSEESIDKPQPDTVQRDVPSMIRRPVWISLVQVLSAAIINDALFVVPDNLDADTFL